MPSLGSSRTTHLILIIALALALIFTLCAPQRADGQTPRGVVPRAGMVVTSTTTLRPGTYRIAAPDSLDTAVIHVRGSGITLDLTGVRLIGAHEDSAPDRARGVAVLIDSGADVTIKGGSIRGYKIGIRATGVRNLRIHDSDLSYNWKPRLYSQITHESLLDWLSFHNNEENQWLRFGAAIYLTGVRGGEVRGVRVLHGMNGLLVSRSDSLRIWNNDFSFNSGLGIGLYRSSDNRIMHNHVEFNVRGYSDGFYRRGQDSAGILLYEQSQRNVIAYNSVTHGGDGLFLWAGQHTMDTGRGGANDNVVVGNDFSYAPTNGIEITFSRNVILGNTVRGSDYGVWGGYSWETVIAGNRFERNRIGVAIEHGQDNRIVGNVFDRDSTGISLWANPVEPSDWGYPRHRDTRSRDYDVAGNSITGARVGFRLANSRGLRVSGNLVRADSVIVVSGDSVDMTPATFDMLDSATARAFVDSLMQRHAPARLAGGNDVIPGRFAHRDRSAMIVDEWGPFDWMSPKLWPALPAPAPGTNMIQRLRPPGIPMALRVHAPEGPGQWAVVGARGATVTPAAGAPGDLLLVTPAEGPVEDWAIELEYRGQATRSPRGRERPADTPYRFGYSQFAARTTWTADVYEWTDATDPRTSYDAFARLLDGTPGEQGTRRLTFDSPRLDVLWYRPQLEGFPASRAAISAYAEVELPEGASYALRAIHNHGARVYLNDELAIDNLEPGGSRITEVPIPPGKHRIRVIYYQVSGWLELRAEIVRR